MISEKVCTWKCPKLKIIVPKGEWGHFLTLTLTSDDRESHIIVNVSVTLTNSTTWFVAALSLIVNVRVYERMDGRTYGQTDIFTGFIRLFLRWPEKWTHMARYPASFATWWWCLWCLIVVVHVFHSSDVDIFQPLVLCHKFFYCHSLQPFSRVQWKMRTRWTIIRKHSRGHSFYILNLTSFQCKYHVSNCFVDDYCCHKSQTGLRFNEGLLTVTCR